MKNYLKFVVAVFGITVATFGSINANAKRNADSNSRSGCSSSTAVCGYHNGTDPILGDYVGC